MVNESYTHIAAVVDRSGSMSPVAADMVGGLDAFFKEQAALPGKCLVDYAQFDDRYELTHKSVPVAYVKAVIEPRGMTALLDAIGKTVADLGSRLRAMKESERPGKVLVVVVTDGHENASREYTRETIANLIKEQEEKYNWEFVFLGANMDAVAVGQSFGFKGDSSITFDINNAVAVGATASSLSGYATTYRSSPQGTKGYKFSDEDREAAVTGK